MTTSFLPALLPPPGYHHPIATTHVYHNADPIPQGTCTGFNSLCTRAGYALETRCHLGQSVIFDTVGRLGWSVDVRHHVIKEVVTKVLGADIWWGDEDLVKDGGVHQEGDKEKKKKRNVPKAIIEEGCIVRPIFRFFSFHRWSWRFRIHRTVINGNLEIFSEKQEIILLHDVFYFILVYIAVLCIYMDTGDYATRKKAFITWLINKKSVGMPTSQPRLQIHSLVSIQL